MVYIAFLFITFLILAFVFYQWQFFMIFSPIYYRQDDLDEYFEMLSIFTDDGVELEGVVFEPESYKATLLFFGGRSHDAVGLIKKLSLAYPNIRIIAFNYRSYGKSGGNLSESNIFSDALLVAQKVQENYGEFYMMGFSLGSSVASYVASKHRCKALFLIGVYDSVAGIAKRKFGVDVSWLFRYKFDNISYAKEIDSPTFVFVSKLDTTTYIENAREIKAYYKNLSFYIELDNLHHKELLWSKEVIKKIGEVMNG